MTDRPIQGLHRIAGNGAAVGKALEGGRARGVQPLLLCILEEEYRQLFPGDRSVRTEEPAAGSAGEALGRRPLHRVGVIRAGRYVPEGISAADRRITRQIIQNGYNLAAGCRAWGEKAEALVPLKSWF